MKVLFVCSGNSTNLIGAVVANQAEALVNMGIEVTIYPIKGKGVFGYLKHSFILRHYINQNAFDIIHAHYVLSAFTATLAGSKPLVISLMGSDVFNKRLVVILIRFLNKKRWRNLIIKSASMNTKLKLKHVYIIPNGVDISVFQPFDNPNLKSIYGFSQNKKTLLFLADPTRKVKNIYLAEGAYKLLPKNKIELQIRYNLPRYEIPQILNAADIILLTSLWEGSPNLIKEAMACNKPIVSTNVGDVPWLFGSENGHFITGFKPDDVAEKIIYALQYTDKEGRTKGRARIIELGLDAENIAKRILEVYQSVLRKDAV